MSHFAQSKGRLMIPTGTPQPSGERVRLTKWHKRC